MHPQLEARVSRELVDLRPRCPSSTGWTRSQPSTTAGRASPRSTRTPTGEPHRPFVVTCRARQYYEPAPDWAGDDERVVLAGLLPDQIHARLAGTLIAAVGVGRRRRANRPAIARSTRSFAVRCGWPWHCRSTATATPASCSASPQGKREGHLWELLSQIAWTTIVTRHRRRFARGWRGWRSACEGAAHNGSCCTNYIGSLPNPTEPCVRFDLPGVGVDSGLRALRRAGFRAGLRLDRGMVFGPGDRCWPAACGIQGVAVPLSAQSGAVHHERTAGPVARRRAGLRVGPADRRRAAQRTRRRLGIGMLAVMAFAALPLAERLRRAVLARAASSSPTRLGALSTRGPTPCSSRAVRVGLCRAGPGRRRHMGGGIVGLAAGAVIGLATAFVLGIPIGAIMGLGTGWTRGLSPLAAQRLAARGVLPASCPDSGMVRRARTRLAAVTDAYEFRHRELWRISPAPPGMLAKDDPAPRIAWSPAMPRRRPSPRRRRTRPRG